MIKGIVAAVPRNVVSNTDPAFIKMTGVRERRIVVPGQDDVGTLALEAAVELCHKMQWEPETIGALIFVTQTPTVRMPAMACILAGRLGITCPAFDVNLACSGYVYGLWIAKQLHAARVLLIAGDTVSTMCDPNDKGTTPLFGDCVTATAVEPLDASLHDTFQLGTDGSGYDKLIADPTIRMDGPEVFNFALRTVPDLIEVVAGHVENYVDWWLFHQANAFMLKTIVKKCKLNPHSVPVNIEKYGNTSSASIPLLMADSWCTSDLRAKPTGVAMFGFGAGWSYAGCLLGLDPLKVCEVVEV